MATMVMVPGTYAPVQANQLRVIQGGQRESRPQVVGPPVGLTGSPGGPGLQVQFGGYSPTTPGAAPWGPGQGGGSPGCGLYDIT